MFSGGLPARGAGSLNYTTRPKRIATVADLLNDGPPPDVRTHRAL
jgi:hypothetical protein